MTPRTKTKKKENIEKGINSKSATPVPPIKKQKCSSENNSENAKNFIRVQVFMMREQKDFLDIASRDIIENRKAEKVLAAQRITANTIIRSLLSVATEVIDFSNLKDISCEEDLVKYIRKFFLSNEKREFLNSLINEHRNSKIKINNPVYRKFLSDIIRECIANKKPSQNFSQRAQWDSFFKSFGYRGNVPVLIQKNHANFLLFLAEKLCKETSEEFSPFDIMGALLTIVMEVFKEISVEEIKDHEFLKQKIRDIIHNERVKKEKSILN